jgi:ADP-ribosylglycohydrolase
MWAESRPFDIGNNARSTIGMMDRVQGVKNLAAFALEHGAKSTKSKSNGSLMRIAPLAVWASNITEIEDLKKIISLDVSFTHSN